MPDKNANAVNHDDNKVRVFTVKELIGKEFVIPSYQRGYRWGDTQVKQLFDDLRNAYNKGWDSYNLQPLVVTWKANEKKWCVIDGQQRLTTLYLLLTALKQKEDKLWALSYDTRSDSKVFLEKIGDWSYADALKNPDYYHMYEAWEQLRELTLTVDTTAFATKIYENVQFIWYEVNQKNEAETFKRLNSGRIPLSNAELIKAFLHEQKFDNFARDWNMMEHELQRADFWSFINPDPDAERFTALHLDFLFEIWLRCKENAEEERFTAKTLENSPFYIFEQVAKNATEAWEGVKEIFRWCQECYQERTTYHLLGFLMRNRQAVEIRFDKLCELFMTQKGTETRSAFVQSLRNACAKVVMKEDRRELNLDLSYGQDNDAIHQLLLLFNLALTEQQSIEQARFPFDVMRQAMWSLEHIHARQEKIEKEAERCYVEECLEEKKVKSGKW